MQLRGSNPPPSTPLTTPPLCALKLRSVPCLSLSLSSATIQHGALPDSSLGSARPQLRLASMLCRSRLGLLVWDGHAWGVVLEVVLRLALQHDLLELVTVNVLLLHQDRRHLEEATRHT